MERGPGRCVCGRSARFPVCDGSHTEAGWTCASAAAAVGVCVVAGHHLRSVAERLAHHLGGVAAHSVSGPIRARRVVALCDGTDLDELLAEVPRLRAGERLALAVDIPAAALARALPGWDLRSVCPPDPLHLWRALLEALNAPSVELGRLHRGFVSHAVADEPVLQPVLDYLRGTAGAELFTCGDSIRPGTQWQAEIMAGLERAERFVLVGSAAAFASTFCAFEAGWAVARGLPVRIIALDETPVPPFLAHLQAADVPRIRRARPWLSPPEVLVESLLQALC